MIWRESPWPLDIIRFSELPIDEWMKIILAPKDSLAIHSEQGQDFLLYAAIVMDSIWLARNKVVHLGSIPQALNIYGGLSKKDIL
jgi:hypothetical protein